MSIRARRAERHLKRAFAELLSGCIEEAKARGATDPQIYFESESGLVVLDGSPHDERTDHARQDRVLFALAWPQGLKGRIDVGAW